MGGLWRSPGAYVTLNRTTPCAWICSAHPICNVSQFLGSLRARANQFRCIAPLQRLSAVPPCVSRPQPHFRFCFSNLYFGQCIHGKRRHDSLTYFVATRVSLFSFFFLFINYYDSSSNIPATQRFAINSRKSSRISKITIRQAALISNVHQMYLIYVNGGARNIKEG